jgi:hypothetical protein
LVVLEVPQNLPLLLLLLLLLVWYQQAHGHLDQTQAPTW